MSNIWSFKDPLRCGFIKLASAGVEKYGTVAKSGFMKKTVTVMVDNYHMNTKYKIPIRQTSKFQVHDPEEMCKVGDKVVIRLCRPISKLKHYYIRNIVYMIPRQSFTIANMLQYEKRALAYNENLQNSADFGVFKENEKI